MRWRLASFLLLVAGCRSPDVVRLGVGYRDEVIGSTPYDGPRGWIEGEWQLSPTTVDFSPESWLFWADQQTHATHSSPGVTIDLPDMGPPAPPPEPDMMDKAGGIITGIEWTMWSVLGILAICLLVWIVKRKVGSPGSPAAPAPRSPGTEPAEPPR